MSPTAARASPGAQRRCATLPGVRILSRVDTPFLVVRSVQLFVPQLVPDLPDPAEAISRRPDLQRLLARARRQRVAADHFEAMLCGAFAVHAQDDWPVAPLTLRADGQAPGEHFWLRADPVHLHAQQSGLMLVDGARLDIASGEAAALVDALNRHFSADGLAFTAPAAARWYVRLPQPARLRTTPVRLAAGRSVDALLPTGADALAWHRRANEAQMLLHAHAVNAAREARGAPAVNSLWFWGGGRLPECSAHLRVWAEDVLTRGLALCARRPLEPLPADAAEWLARAGDGEHLVTLETLSGGQRGGWDERLAHLERAWLEPLLRAVARGGLQLALVTHHAGNSLRFTLSRSDLWKLWRRVHV